MHLLVCARKQGQNLHASFRENNLLQYSLLKNLTRHWPPCDVSCSQTAHPVQVPGSETDKPTSLPSINQSINQSITVATKVSSLTLQQHLTPYLTLRPLLLQFLLLCIFLGNPSLNGRQRFPGERTEQTAFFLWHRRRIVWHCCCCWWWWWSSW